MPKHNKWDWGKIQDQITSRYGNQFPSAWQLSKEFGVPYETMRSWLIRTNQPTNRGVEVLQKVPDKVKIHAGADGSKDVLIESGVPKTPEEMAIAVGIDIEKFDVISFDAFSREVFVKDQDKDLFFDEGRITGTIKSTGKLNIQVVWSTRVLFRPKTIPDQIIMLKPVQIVMPDKPDVRERIPMPDRKVVLVIPDIHFGFTKFGRNLSPMHDEEALEILVSRIPEIKPTHIVMLGDVVDLAEMSSFQTTPNQIGLVQESLVATSQFLQELHRVATTAKKYWIEGNHEARFSKFIARQFPVGFGLRTADGKSVSDIRTYLPGLEDFNVTYIPNYPNAFVTIDRVVYEHGTSFSSTPGGSVGKVLKNATSSVVFGHSHRAEIAHLRLDRSYKNIFAFNAGCLCHIDGRVPGSNNKVNWQVGFGVVDDGVPTFYQLK